MSTFLQFVNRCNQKHGMIAVMVAATTLFVGCGKGKEPWETTFPVKGVITFKGKPVADAELSFFPENASYPDSVRPRAKSGADGSFVVWTYDQGDGAPVGSYKVTAVHHEVAISKDTVITKPNDLPAKYSRLESTDIVVVVSAPATELPPIDLQ